jgi:hypothetical protein
VSWRAVTDVVRTLQGGIPQVLRHFLDLFVKRAAPQEQLTAAIKYIIIPLVQRAHEKKEADAVTDADLDTIVQKLLGPPQHISGALQ